MSAAHEYLVAHPLVFGIKPRTQRDFLHIIEDLLAAGATTVLPDFLGTPISFGLSFNDLPAQFQVPGGSAPDKS